MPASLCPIPVSPSMENQLGSSTRTMSPFKVTGVPESEKVAVTSNVFRSATYLALVSDRAGRIAAGRGERAHRCIKLSNRLAVDRPGNTRRVHSLLDAIIKYAQLGLFSKFQRDVRSGSQYQIGGRISICATGVSSACAVKGTIKKNARVMPKSARFMCSILRSRQKNANLRNRYDIISTDLRRAQIPPFTPWRIFLPWRLGVLAVHSSPRNLTPPSTSLELSVECLLIIAGVAELADAQDLGSCTERCRGSIPLCSTSIDCGEFHQTISRPRLRAR